MREIKFRGKHIESDEWLYGSHYDDCGEEYILPCMPGSATDYEDYQVDPNTVGQYTGLKDKNGKEIYEGDIMRNDEGHVCEVVWDEFSCGFRQHDHYLELMDNFIEEEFDEVIGNRYDNPELLMEG